VFLVETVENAQPHEAAGACVRHFNRRRKEAGDAQRPLAGLLTYSVLGLGDTNLLLDRQTTTAKDCNQAASTLDGALRALGGTQVHPRGEANDAVGLQEGVKPWAQSLWPKLSALKQQQAATTDSASASQTPDVTILFGSQTGNSAEIARTLCASCPGHGIQAQVMPMDDTTPAAVLHPGAVLIFVVSSTGDGDPPDNCARFTTGLRRLKAEPAGVGVQYAVLGLGDQNYTKFMAMPRFFSARMDAIGATAFCARGEADETEGLFEAVDKWTEQLWPALTAAIADASKRRESVQGGAVMGDATNVLPSAKAQPVPVVQLAANGDADGVPALVPCRVTATWLTPEQAAAQGASVGDGRPTQGDGSSPSCAFYARLGPDARLLTAPSSDRVVMHVSFDVSQAGDALRGFQPGDSIGVFPVNAEHEVTALLHRLNVTDDVILVLQPADALPHICRGGCAAVRAGDALRHCVEISAPPRRAVLRLLAEHASDALEKQQLLRLCSRAGKDAYEAEVVRNRATLCDILARFPSCAPPFEAVLDALPPLMPRMYSIACAPEASADRPCVAFSLVRFPPSTNGVERTGVATGYLHSLVQKQLQGHAGSVPTVPIFIRSGGAFAPPSELETPVIMVGPGAGVAPFRGFLQRRAARGAVGSGNADWWLFFGCRAAVEDYLYRDDFEGWASDGTLKHLVTAFSREALAADGSKVYVQHHVLQHGQALAALIKGSDAQRPAYVYVCGDGSGMAKGVHAALLEILQQYGDMSADAATACLSDMTKAGRYVRDIWSA